MHAPTALAHWLRTGKTTCAVMHNSTGGLGCSLMHPCSGDVLNPETLTPLAVCSKHRYVEIQYLCFLDAMAAANAVRS